MLKGLIAGILFGNLWVEIPTYVRNDNSEVVYQAHSINTVTNAKRLNNFLESNRGFENTERLSIGYIPGGMNTTDGLTKSATGVKLRRLINGNIFPNSNRNAKGKLGSGYQPKNIILRIQKPRKGKRIPTTTQG